MSAYPLKQFRISNLKKIFIGLLCQIPIIIHISIPQWRIHFLKMWNLLSMYNFLWRAKQFDSMSQCFLSVPVQIIFLCSLYLSIKTYLSISVSIIIISTLIEFSYTWQRMVYTWRCVTASYINTQALFTVFLIYLVMLSSSWSRISSSCSLLALWKCNRRSLFPTGVFHIFFTCLRCSFNFTL